VRALLLKGTPLLLSQLYCSSALNLCPCNQGKFWCPALRTTIILLRSEIGCVVLGCTVPQVPCTIVTVTNIFRFSCLRAMDSNILNCPCTFTTLVCLSTHAATLPMHVPVSTGGRIGSVVLVTGKGHTFFSLFFLERGVALGISSSISDESCLQAMKPLA
jgi:hypothetical protein